MSFLSFLPACSPVLYFKQISLNLTHLEVCCGDLDSFDEFWQWATLVTFEKQNIADVTCDVAAILHIISLGQIWTQNSCVMNMNKIATDRSPTIYKLFWSFWFVGCLPRPCLALTVPPLKASARQGDWVLASHRQHFAWFLTLQMLDQKHLLRPQGNLSQLTKIN